MSRGVWLNERNAACDAIKITIKDIRAAAESWNEDVLISAGKDLISAGKNACYMAVPVVYRLCDRSRNSITCSDPDLFERLLRAHNVATSARNAASSYEQSLHHYDAEASVMTVADVPLACYDIVRSILTYCKCETTTKCNLPPILSLIKRDDLPDEIKTNLIKLVSEYDYRVLMYCKNKLPAEVRRIPFENAIRRGTLSEALEAIAESSIDPRTVDGADERIVRAFHAVMEQTNSPQKRRRGG